MAVLLDACPSMTYVLSFVSMSFSLASHISFIVMHAGMSVATSMAFMLSCRPAISSSLFSL